MNILLRKAKRTREIWRKRGQRGIKQHLKQLRRVLRERRKYQRFIRDFECLTASDRKQISRRIENFSRKPLISVVMPVYNVKEKWLRLCIESVTKQIYPYWEFCIADDYSPSPHIRKVLEEYAAYDKRFKIIFRKTNGHISAASNSALELASGEFVVLLDHDDELHETALYHVAAELNADPQIDMIYSDEDMIDGNGRRYLPKFKPDWSPDLFYSLNLITHLSAYRTKVLREIDGFRPGTEGSQDYDLALRVTEQIPVEHIKHIPRVLYHWRAIEGSVALEPEEKPYAHARAKQAIREYFQRQGITANVTKGYSHLHRAVYEIPENTIVSIILFGDNIPAIENFPAMPGAGKVEIILIGREAKKTGRAAFIKARETVAESLNQAAAEARGEVLIFLDANVRPLNEIWLMELTRHALQKEIGAAGGKILNTDATIRNAGIILGMQGAIGFAHQGFPADVTGNFLRAMVINNFSAVSGAFAVRREIFGGGFDAKNFPNGLFEIDFCLRLREQGLRNVFTPYAEFLQTAESPTEKVLRRGSAEVLYFKEKWKNILERDPYYNPNFSLAGETFSIALSPRISKI